MWSDEPRNDILGMRAAVPTGMASSTVRALAGESEEGSAGEPGGAEPPADSPADGMPVHEPAMVQEVLQWTQVRSGAVCIDATVGTGGHALVLAEQAGPDGFVLGLDRDSEALAVARCRLAEQDACRFKLVNARFAHVAEIAADAGIETCDVILADLGLGTHQVDVPERGFSFMEEGQLDMRFGREEDVPTAADVLATASETALSDIFREYGEERYHRAIAKAICQARTRKPITTTTQLSDIAKRVVGAKTRGRRLRIHPASRVMMALRIYVNGELDELAQFLDRVPALLRPRGRVAIQCYHSLESRLVKHRWRAQKQQGLLQELKDSPVKPTEREVRRNRRVRSVQMRVAEKP